MRPPVSSHEHMGLHAHAIAEQDAYEVEGGSGARPPTEAGPHAVRP